MAGRFTAGNPSEHCVGHKPGAAGIVEVVQTTHKFPGGEEAIEGPVFDVNSCRGASFSCRLRAEFFHWF